MPGEGNITINKRPSRTTSPSTPCVLSSISPSRLCPRRQVRRHRQRHGGGMTGQAGAIRHGIARALCVCDRKPIAPFSKRQASQARSRQKERKKYGLHKARRHLNSPRDNRAIWRTASKSLPQCGHVRFSTLPFAEGVFSRKYPFINVSVSSPLKFKGCFRVLKDPNIAVLLVSVKFGLISSK